MNLTRFCIVLLAALAGFYAWDLNKTPTPARFRINRLGSFWSGDHGKLAMKLDSLNLVHHSAMIKHSLKLLEEIHTANNLTWTSFPDYNSFLHVAVSKIERIDLVTRNKTPVLPLDKSETAHATLFGSADQQKEYVVKEITALTNEVDEISDQLFHVWEKWGYVEVFPHTEKFQDPREHIAAIHKAMTDLNFATFVDENKNNATLRTQEILDHLKTPIFNVDTIVNQTKRDEVTRLMALQTTTSHQKHSLGVANGLTPTFLPWAGKTPGTKEKRQAIFAAGLVGTAIGWLGSSLLGGSSIFSGYVTRSDLAAVLKDVNHNQKELQLITEDVGNLTLLTEHVFQRQEVFYQHLLTLDGRLFLQTRKIDFLNTLSLVRPLIDSYRTAVNRYVKSIHDVSHSQFPDSLVKLANLVQPLKQLYAKANLVGYEHISNDARLLLSCKAKLYAIDFQIAIIVEVPLKKQSLSLPEIYYVPSGQKVFLDGLSYSLELPSDLFQIQKDLKSVAPLPHFSFESCKIFEPQLQIYQTPSLSSSSPTFLCSEQSEARSYNLNILSHDSQMSLCILALIANDKPKVLESCPLFAQVLQTEVATLLGKNEFAVSSSRSFEKILYCSEVNPYTRKSEILSKNRYFEKNLILRIPSNCFLVTEKYVLIPDFDSEAAMVSVNPQIIRFDTNDLFDFINLYANQRFRDALDLREKLRDLSLTANITDLKQDIRKLGEIRKNLPKPITFSLPDHPVIKTIQAICVSLLMSIFLFLCIYFFAKRFPTWIRLGREKLWETLRCRKSKKDQTEPSAGDPERPSGQLAIGYQKVSTSDQAPTADGGGNIRCPACDEVCCQSLKQNIYDIRKEHVEFEKKLKELENRMASSAQ